MKEEISVVFLHHFGGSSRSWRHVMSRLPGIRCISPDLAGFGAATISTGRFEFEDHVSQVEDVAREAGGRFLLVGHSMGGKIAMAAVARGLPGAEGLLLLAPSPPTPEPIPEEKRHELSSVLKRRAGGEVVGGITGDPLPPDLFSCAVEDIHRAAPAAWDAWLARGSRRDISAEMEAIRIPTAVYAGSRDRAIEPAVIRREVLPRLTQATFGLIPDVGHLLPLESPAAVATAVRSMLTDAHRRPGPAGTAGTALPGRPGRDLYPSGSVLGLFETDYLTDPTRRALIARLDAKRVNGPAFLTPSEFETLRAVACRLIPPRGPVSSSNFDLAGAVDARLAQKMGNGWRYAAMPPDGEAIRRGLAALDLTSKQASGLPFARLDAARQDLALGDLQMQRAGRGPWEGISPARFFEELLTELSELFFSHPAAQEGIGYVGMADARGWQRIGLNQLDAAEPSRTLTKRRACHA